MLLHKINKKMSKIQEEQKSVSMSCTVNALNICLGSVFKKHCHQCSVAWRQ